MADEMAAQQVSELSRRELLMRAGKAPALVALAGGSAGAAATLLAPPEAGAEVLSPTVKFPRAAKAFRVRRRAASAQFDVSVRRRRQRTNEDDEIYSDFRGSFHKCLPQNQFAEVAPSAYRALRKALRRGNPRHFDAIPLSPISDRRLANPQAALAFNLSGIDPHGTRMDPAPAFASAETAAEMGEVYWHALLRELPFARFGDDQQVADALADLNAFSETVGPKVGGLVTADTLFRGETNGDLTGPYVSQFLLKDVGFGQATITQRYNTPDASNFMTDHASWLAIQRGALPTAGISHLTDPRYIYNGRALSAYVQVDALYQAYLFAALIGLGFGGDALAENAYSGNSSQAGFTTLGGAELLDTVAHVANLGLRAAWYQKWAVHRRLRPEVFAARVSFELSGDRNYGISDDILSSAAAAELLYRNGNSLLPLAYPEGSPEHPAYPAGHAVVAGACSTVLKAFFDEGFVIPDPVVASDDGRSLESHDDDLTMGNEINKLASNVTLGRDHAGVHYRSDGIDGLSVGEDVALRHLADMTRTYNEDFGGFRLRRFDGTPMLVVDGSVYEA